MGLDLPDKPNFLIIMTDQERAPMHWPDGWARANLPAMQRLKSTGLTFNRAFTNTCQCSSSRATLHTSSYPAEHLVTSTFGPGAGRTPQTLRANQTNLARVLRAAGYHVAYKGKWHITRPVNQPLTPTGVWTSMDVDHLERRYGYAEWNPPDAGNSLSDLDTLGDGKARHDRRYISGERSSAGHKSYGESAVEFLERYNGQQPFCLFVSLVNPHDIFVFPRTYRKAGFALKHFKSLPIGLPPNYQDDMTKKPAIQRALLEYFRRYDPILDEKQALQYARFYAWLHIQVDQLISTLLDTLDANGLTTNTLIIRISDHGEMGLSHGGLRQKEYNCYEETMRIPMVFSNPVMFPTAQQTKALAGLIDILPTLASVAGVDQQLTSQFRGVDLTPTLIEPMAKVQDHVHFTYDDDFLPDLGVPAYIRCLRTERWKYAVYYDPMTGDVDYELYDLEDDPLELDNLAWAGVRRNQHRALHEQLMTVMETARTFPDEIVWPKV